MSNLVFDADKGHENVIRYFLGTESSTTVYMYRGTIGCCARNVFRIESIYCFNSRSISNAFVEIKRRGIASDENSTMLVE